ncbi:hypothetical protein EDC30_1232 [Paucimonas lemoignei]|uniref:Uncharacterized protein n=1 Tax=Paucimonas lemoignei TaxID=29443 RepID=A0A4R3HTQ0_PAULE|nr:hypothetical protein [Paucimonas lemoignei]TCS32438.1 hypothetical protein EDC30_1232 [Paucimonas lemoignei]
MASLLTSNFAKRTALAPSLHSFIVLFSTRAARAALGYRLGKFAGKLKVTQHEQGGMPLASLTGATTSSGETVATGIEGIERHDWCHERDRPGGQIICWLRLSRKILSNVTLTGARHVPRSGKPLAHVRVKRNVIPSPERSATRSKLFAKPAYINVVTGQRGWRRARNLQIQSRRLLIFAKTAGQSHHRRANRNQTAGQQSSRRTCSLSPVHFAP